MGRFWYQQVEAIPANMKQSTSWLARGALAWLKCHLKEKLQNLVRFAESCFGADLLRVMSLVNRYG